jgi:hypothetical protein
VKPITVQPLIRSFAGGTRLPPRATERIHGVFAYAQDFLAAWTGKTFKLAYPKRLVSRYTVEEAATRAGAPDRQRKRGTELMRQALAEFEDRAAVKPKSLSHVYYVLQLHPPEYATNFSPAGAWRRQWWWPELPPEAAGACASVGTRPWVMAGVTPEELLARGWPMEPDMQGRIHPPGEPRPRTVWNVTARTAPLHEILHTLGLHHPQDDPATPLNEGYESVTGNGYRLAYAGLLPSEIEALLASGYLA